MKLTKLFFLTFVIFSGLFLSACSAKDTAQIQVDVNEFSFNDVTNGDIVTKEILLTNIGSQTLIIENVSTSCGCTVATIESSIILPGNTAVLNIEFDSGAHGPDVTGQITRMVFVNSNDPVASEITIIFTANIVLPTSP